MNALRLVTAAVLLWCASALADQVEVVQLQHRTAEQMIPALRPLLSPGAALTGMHSSLVIRSDRANIEALKRVIVALDRAPRRLMISVRQDVGGSSVGRSVAAGATVAGNRGRASVGQGAPVGGGVNAHVTDSTSAGDDRLLQQVQALEGSPAYISIGQSVPVPSRTVTRGLGGAIVSDSVVYRDTASGFYVLPRIAGDRVTLEIDPQREAPGRYPGSVRSQRLATTVSGRLGEWFELGGIDRSTTREERGVLSRSTASRQSSSRVWVRVDELE